MTTPESDPHPELRKPFEELTPEQRRLEAQEWEDGAPAREDDGTPVGEDAKIEKP